MDSPERAVKKEGYIGFKSVVASRVGLRNLKQDENSAREVYWRLKGKDFLRVPLKERTQRVLRMRGFSEAIYSAAPLRRA